MSFALEYQTVTDNAPTEQPRPRQQQGSAVRHLKIVSFLLFAESTHSATHADAKSFVVIGSSLAVWLV